ncbi:uncharacterized protein LOC107371446 [Tetranychus urticae]|uniref:uncharacterized protein LOC107371446 n=1 Tax=Tetranychus urticae TaxID=32264 RepID=UPI00077BAD5B|nr:uncharacterized protein LOC107371446 [Tetranychus urticae]
MDKLIIRAKIKGYHEAGLPAPAIAKNLNIHVNTVYKWIKRDNLNDMERSGRPSKVTPETQKMITNELKETSQGYCDMNFDGELRRLHVLYTDESWIQLHQAPNAQNFRFRTDNPEKFPKFPLPKHPIKIMVAGGICGFGKTDLHIIKDKITIDNDYYRNVILPIYFNALKNPELMVDPELAMLMQDGAPCHSAEKSIQLIEEQIDDNYWGIGIWPGGSPDLNPIEHVWAMLQNSIFVEPRPKNKEE